MRRLKSTALTGQSQKARTSLAGLVDRSSPREAHDLFIAREQVFYRARDLRLTERLRQTRQIHDIIGRSGVARDQQNQDFRIYLPDAAGEFAAVDPGHLIVGDDEVDREPAVEPVQG